MSDFHHPALRAALSCQKIVNKFRHLILDEILRKEYVPLHHTHLFANFL